MVTLAIDDPATFRRINTDQPVIMFRGTGDKAQESGQGRLVKKSRTGRRQAAQGHHQPPQREQVAKRMGSSRFRHGANLQ